MHALILLWLCSGLIKAATPSTNDLWDISQGAVVTATSGVFPASDPRDMFGGSFSSVEPTQTLFADGQPQEFVHYIEWQTPAPVTLRWIRLFAAGDGPEYNNEREFAKFTLRAKSSPTSDYDLFLYGFAPSHPYTFVDATNSELLDVAIPAVTAQYFRAEFVQFNGGRGYDGPRILELDGFSEAPGKLMITAQPQDVTASAGASVRFSVKAEGSEPLQYQWLFNDTAIPGAISDQLVLANVSAPNAGVYKVIVTNPSGVLSSQPAVLTVLTGGPNANLLNLNFTAHLNPGFTVKQGPAAVGNSPTDYWNVYSRDVDSEFNWRDHGQVTNLLWADGTASGANVTVTNAEGAWFTFSNDPMLKSYLYPLSRMGNIGVSFDHLPAGTYQLYVYAHGQPSTENAVVRVATDTKDYGSKVTSDAPSWDAVEWTEGQQFVRFDSIDISSAQSLSITVSGGDNGLAVINGIQLKHPSVPSPQTGVVSTLAGSGLPAFQDGIGKGASFNAPNGGFVGPDNAAYIADAGNHRIRRVDLVSGTVTTVAGSGIVGDVNGNALNAQFNSPLGLSVDKFGTIWVADTGNNRIRKISTDNPRMVSDYVGTGVAGYLDGPVSVAQLNYPDDVALDSKGNILISEFNNHAIRKVTAGVVMTLAGNGSPGFKDGVGMNAGLNQPAGLAVDANDNLYVTEWGSHRIRKITPDGVVSTLAGSVFAGFLDGQGVEARFLQPDGIAVSPTGILYVTEHGNSSIRRITPDGTVTTVSGTGIAGYLDGPASQAQFNAPGGLGLDASGNIVVADTSNNRIRYITFISTPTVVISPTAPAVLAGTDVQLTATVNVPGAASFVWKFNGNVLGAPDSPVLRLLSVQSKDAGRYSVVVTTSAGVVESAAVELVVLQPLSFTRQLPPYYGSGGPITVTLQGTGLANSSDQYAYAIEETPPPGWTVGNVSDGGTYDSVTGKVKFGPFFDLVPRRLSYNISSPPGATGPAYFKGLLSINGVLSPIGGDSTMVPAPFHPADNQPSDFRISINEVTAYASAWRAGKPWSTGPSPIPIDYLTRAGLLWKRGEAYRFDASAGSAPMWWVPSATVSVASLHTLDASGSSTQNVVTCSVPAVFVPGEPFTVHLQAEPLNSVAVYAVEEIVPATLTIFEISDSGQYDAADQHIRWGPFFDNLSRDLTFKVIASASATSLAFSGTASFDGSSQAIQGASWVSAGVRLGLARVSSKGDLVVQVSGADGAKYLVEASEDLETWAKMAVAVRSGGTIQFNDPDGAKPSQRFYRVTQQP